MKRVFTKNIVVVVVILVLVFLGQQPAFRKAGRDLQEKGIKQARVYSGVAQEWFLANVWPSASKEVEKRGQSLTSEAGKVKDAAAQTVWEKIKNYFAAAFSKAVGTEVK